MNKTNLQNVSNITTGKLNANAATTDGKFPYFTCRETPLRIDYYDFDDDVILLAGNNAQGNFHCQRFSGKFNAYQRTYVITAKSQYDIDYIYYNLLINLRELQKMAQGSQTKFLTIEILNDFELRRLSLDEQKHLVSLLVSVDKAIKNNNKINDNLAT